MSAQNTLYEREYMRVVADDDAHPDPVIWLADDLDQVELSYTREEMREILPILNKWMGESAPINLLLFCPSCGEQHVDAARPGVCETCGAAESECVCANFKAWLNPPHKSHRCNFCNHVWRPADVPTNGVAAIESRGSRDGSAAPRLTLVALDSPMENLEDERSAPYADDGYANAIDCALTMMRDLAATNAEEVTA